MADFSCPVDFLGYLWQIMTPFYCLQCKPVQYCSAFWVLMDLLFPKCAGRWVGGKTSSFLRSKTCCTQCKSIAR